MTREVLNPVKLARERAEFLDEVAAVRPDALASLRDVIPQWQGAAGDRVREGELLARWMQRFQLDAPWVRKALRSTLQYWAVLPPEKERPDAWPAVVKNTSYRIPELPVAPSMVLPPWDVEFESEQAYESRVGAAAKKLARQHVAAVRARIVESKAWPLVRPTRGAGPKRAESPRWRWLAMFQVKGMSYDAIADVDVDPSTVRRSVASAAGRIGLPLRR